MSHEMANDFKLSQRAIESVKAKGTDPPRFGPEPTCHVFGSNLVANCAEYYGSAGSSGY
jgi:hypothetical protein